MGTIVAVIPMNQTIAGAFVETSIGTIEGSESPPIKSQKQLNQITGFGNLL